MIFSTSIYLFLNIVSLYRKFIDSLRVTRFIQASAAEMFLIPRRLYLSRRFSRSSFIFCISRLNQLIYNVKHTRVHNFYPLMRTLHASFARFVSANVSANEAVNSL